MQPDRHAGPYDPAFDMSKLSAAMPQPEDPYYQYRQPQPYIHGLGVSSPPFYPAYQGAQIPNAAGGSQFLPRHDMSWRQQEMNRSPGIDQRSRFHNWGVLPPQQLATMVVSSSLGAEAPGASDVTQPQHRELRRRSVPSSPRGPPRKPKRSGYALWVGNLPPTTRIEELKDHFSTGATQDIDSVFLISKSNCAFVNYGTERACVAAMNRFHNSRFRGRALVCRLRKTAEASQTPAMPTSTPSELSAPPDDQMSPTLTDGPASPVIVGRRVSLIDGAQASKRQVDDGRLKIPEKFFILKSLTLEDLESSITTRTWATQPHNENVLNQAYEESSNVYLIFSANKSGEYFGYARMASPVSAQSSSYVDMRKDSAKALPDNVDEDAPRTIVTPPTSTAPKGRIIDDSARGSIFWEADHSPNTDENAVEDDVSGNHVGGGLFTIEWQSTTKLPFYQTRGMRNSFNGNREIKIARDGQELDPRVGRRLIQLFRATPSPSLVDNAQ